jgi:ribosomal protein S18 acetylase RimI-like enzyme
MTFIIRPFESADQAWAANLWRERWASVTVSSRGKLHYALELAGFVAWLNDQRAGIITYRQDGMGGLEIVTLDSLIERVGLGTALIEAVRTQAQEVGCRRVWLITSNDNLNGMRFYQKRGMRLVAIHRDAITEARKTLKPSIPFLGDNDIPIMDEIELEFLL